LELLHDFLILK